MNGGDCPTEISHGTRDFHKIAAKRLMPLVGSEQPVREMSRALRQFVQDLRPPVVGAMQITCADEAEHECVEALQREFVHYALPDLKFATQCALRIANLGGRYEWGAVCAAENHFTIPASRSGYKLIVAKVNAHAGAETSPTGERYGVLQRYGTESPCCGVLRGLLDGEPGPHLEELRESFRSEGEDRLAILTDGRTVPPERQSLFAAIVAARLQARQIMIDIQDHEPASPTLYLVLPCVTLNRREKDTEIPCGIYTADHRSAEPCEEYFGLGDAPGDYRLTVRNRRIHIEDAGAGRVRPARNHRHLAQKAWGGRKAEISASDHKRLREAMEKVDRNKHHADLAKPLLKMLLPLLAEVAPIPVAIALFAQGAAHVSHVHRVHRLARELGESEDARRILREVHGRIDALDPRRAQALVEVLASEYRLT
jgi:hypothetical protein